MSDITIPNDIMITKEMLNKNETRIFLSSLSKKDKRIIAKILLENKEELELNDDKIIRLFNSSLKIPSVVLISMVKNMIPKKKLKPLLEKLEKTKFFDDIQKLEIYKQIMGEQK